MLTESAIINAAFRKIGSLSDYETLTAAQLLAGSNALRPALLHLQTQGMPLWKLYQYTYLFGLMPLGTAVMGVGQTLNTTNVPLKMISAQRYDTLAMTTVPLNILTRTEWFELTRPNVTGVPTHVYFDPLKTTANVFLWPNPDQYWSINGNLQIDVQQSWDNLPNQPTYTGTPDFPDWWEQALIYELACRLAPEYGLSMSDRSALLKERKEILEEVLGFGNEEGSVYFQPTADWSRR